MSVPDGDGIDEALQGAMQAAMTAAARLGEQLARLHEQQARNAQAGSEQTARELGQRLHAERAAARATLSPVHRQEWWDTATADDVTNAYVTATTWSEVDPDAARARHRIVEQVRDRYGIDMGTTGTGTGSGAAGVAEAMERAEQARAHLGEQRNDAATTNQAGVDRLIAAADAADRATADAAVEALQDGVTDHQVHPVVDDLPDRHGVDGPAAQAHPQRGLEAVEGAVGTRPGSEHERSGQLRQDAAPAYDSPERREATAKSLDHIENQAAVDARLHADIAQGRPATDAVTSTPRRAAQARTTKGSQQGVAKAQRPGQKPVTLAPSPTDLPR